MNDLINRQDAIDAPEKFIKDCNPEHFLGHQKFIEFMDDVEIGSFGNWQFANGFNLGLTAAEVEIEKLLSVQPVIRCKDCKHYKFADNRAFGFPVRRCEWTGFEDVDDDDFCSRAERREE